MGSAYPPPLLLHSIACHMGRLAKRSTPWAGRNRLCTPMLVSHPPLNVVNTWSDDFCMIFWNLECIATRHSVAHRTVFSDVAKGAAALLLSTQEVTFARAGSRNHCLGAVSG